ncbi:MAG: CopG family transcriptional regulator [Gemmatimonadota bacterium]|nr:CopG family transcriptional regulator [Gemmatimonadota bacterium]
MKTAISLPDALHVAGDKLAKRLGVSRSELYARALAEYLAKHRTDRVTEQLNAVYAAESVPIDPLLSRAQRMVIPPESW